MISIKKYKNYVLKILCGLVCAQLAAVASANCEYKVVSDWPGGFVAFVSVTNTSGESVDNWQVSWRYSTASGISNSWSAELEGTNPYSASGAPWNRELGAGETVEFGFQGYKAEGDAEIPVLSGSLCDSVDVFSSSQSSAMSESSRSYSSSSNESSVSSVVSSSSSSVIATRVDNPFYGATPYINPLWSERVAEVPDGYRIANTSTAVWLESMSDIEMLEYHLQTAKAQGADLLNIVLYNLPMKRCELIHRFPDDYLEPAPFIHGNNFRDYTTNFIDPVVALLSNPDYASLRVVVVLEPGAIGSLVIGSNKPNCREAEGPGGYLDGIRYALDSLKALSNVYTYLDIANSSKLGWDGNALAAQDYILELMYWAESHWDSIAGFATNVGGYVPVKEPFLPEYTLTAIGNERAWYSQFYQWNPMMDESTFAYEWRRLMIENGAPESIGMIIDTSRNGWGGSERPQQVSAATDLDAFVDESRIDRRVIRSNDCNQASGLGLRPEVAPEPGVDAYAWIAAPGISDGGRFERSACNPDGHNPYEDNFPTEAMPGAPERGKWFEAGFNVLLDNAYPPVR